MTAGLTPRRALTVLLAIVAFRRVGSMSVMRADGIVIVASAPPRPGTGAEERAADVPPALSAMITPIAPASCAFFTFTVKPHVPRSIIAILPATFVVMAEQPSVVDGP